MPRFRQMPMGMPPNIPFERNVNSMQSAGLVAWWPPGRYPGMGYGVPDMAGNLPATMVGSLGWRYNPVFGWSPDYVADTSKYLTGGTSSLLNPLDTMSITVWVSLDSVANSKFVDRDSNGQRGYWFGLYSAQLDLGMDGSIISRGNGPALSINTAYHVALTGNAVQGWYMFINGVKVVNVAWRAPGNATALSTLIGRGSYPGYEAPIDGAIGDVRIYHRCLSEREVWQLYDPITRWELYKPLRRMWAVKASGAVTPPTAPSALTATATSSSNIDLTWTDNSADETGFKVARSTDNASWSVIHTTAADAVSWSDTTCAANARYYYKVCATNAGGDSAYTSVANAKTAPDSAAKSQKFLLIIGGQVEQSDGRYLALVDGVPTPDTVAGIAWLYVDQADGDLKMKFGDGTVKVISADT